MTISTVVWILILVLSGGLFLFLGALIFCPLTSVETGENQMIEKDEFLKDLKRILSNPLFCYNLYDSDVLRILKEHGFSKDYDKSVEKFNRATLDSLKSIFEIGFGSPKEPLCEQSLKLTKEQIEFEKEQVRNRDEENIKNLMKELSKIPCERRVYNRGHYFENEDGEGGFCVFCRRHAYTLRKLHEIPV